jgi:hypothetical protein
VIKDFVGWIIELHTSVCEVSTIYLLSWKESRSCRSRSCGIAGETVERVRAGKAADANCFRLEV